MKKNIILVMLAILCLNACGKIKSAKVETTTAETETSAVKETQVPETTTEAVSTAAEPTSTAVEKQKKENKLPAFVYVGMNEAARICTAQSEIINKKMYEQQDVMIPAFVIADFDESDDNDMKIWANLWTFNYKLEGDNLLCKSGGEYPCLMHIKLDPGSANGYKVFKVETVTDGTNHDKELQKICENDESRVKMLNDHTAMEEQRKQLIEMYVSNFGLPVKSYQDEGSEKIMLENLS
ncbi:MAG TPA: hypothetical protein DCS54_00575 [Oribacterium sp.]|jgi:hypothetical protein|nr:hypothetical protein [Oribacterium sp.]